MSSFAPVHGLLGGSLIGLGAASLLLGGGEIMGASGISTSFVRSPKAVFSDAAQWKLAFMSSFLSTSYLLIVVADTDFGKFVWSGSVLDPKVGAESGAVPAVSFLGYGISGLLVGLGTRIGNGCTSGHGICGLARLSRRSFASVITFMSFGIIVASSITADSKIASICYTSAQDTMKPSTVSKNIGTGLPFLALYVLAKKLYYSHVSSKIHPINEVENTKLAIEKSNNNMKMVPAGLSGALFSFGLVLSTMVKPSKIFGFLNVRGFSKGNYDPTLIAVMSSGLLLSFASYQFVNGYSLIYKKAMEKPYFLQECSSNGKFFIPSNRVIDKKLTLGASLFGIGWGIGGLCPGPAMVLGVAGVPGIVFAWLPT
eukprot:CAMPEP_0116068144 /NCGR_PEP_ID=MMETSP0322-20121206/11482_1 /TAXON_ID=163516 /ORGANISM="Leptocylindrus danicus var. apora, Strain B651" /LENGTH=369 /DNA_ID=CAMNT_0003555191 /DNA_START=279 /DNA_END=1385 /DNA_ORIENTATION=+